MKTKITISIIAAAAVVALLFNEAGAQSSNANANAFNNNGSLISVAPNPVLDDLNVHFNKATGQTEFMIVDNSGQVVYSMVVGKISHPGNAHYSIATFNPGWYNLIYKCDLGTGNVPFIKQ